MYTIDSPTAGHSTSSTVTIELRDWKPVHRELSDERRRAAREYIVAIILRDPLVRDATPELQQRVADALWRRFRELYDALHHGEREDFMRAINRI